MAFTKATIDYLDAGGLIDWQTTAKTSAFTAVSGEGYLVDTSSAAITVTLPTAPSAGDEIIIVDYASNAGTNNITLDPGTLNLRGTTDDFVMSTNNQSLRLLYSGATKGWLVTSDANGSAAAAPATPAPDLTVDYLVVAGGGGGASVGGGGGAGGLRTSYTNSSSLNGHTETALSLSTTTNYTVTIGAGGGSYTWPYSGDPGDNSTFHTITSTGGGSGTHVEQATTVKDGGSGGGTDYQANNGGYAVTTPVTQGHDGGTTGFTHNPTYPGAGGGGAGGNGLNGTAASNPGGGGVGLAVNIISTTNAGTASVGEVSGSDVYFAGGGSGGSRGSGSDVGGLGGGGNSNANSVGDNGTPNTGGGGGSAGATSGAASLAGAGGSGVVILRYPDAYTITVGSGITEASSSPFTEGSNKVSVFTAGTGSITFAEA